MSLALIGKKIGMTRLFDEKGKITPVSLVSLYKLYVCDVKTKEKHGYSALVLGYDEVSEKKIKKAQAVFFTKNNLPFLRNLFEVTATDLNSYKVGDVVSFDDLSLEGKNVNITGVSIGKGFAGSMKRHNFAGLRASHGVSVSHRSHGSTGACQDPGKVFKNKKMAGQMGNKQVTIKNLTSVRFDKDKSVLFISGAIPGARNSNVKIIF